MLVVTLVADDLLTDALVGPEVLLARRRVVRDDRVGGFEDPLGRAVVLIEHDHRGVGERILELQQVAEVGAAEPVHALRVVADDHDAAMFDGEQAHDFPLRGVRVLELVDEDVAEPLLVPEQRLGVLAEQANREQQQVVEVDGRRLGQPPLVLGVDLRDPALGRSDRLFGVLLGQDQLVLERADLRVQLTGGEPLGVEVEVAAHPVGETLRVGLVVDREARPVTEQRRFPPQDARARGVEGRDPHTVPDRTEELRDPLAHLARGLVGERDREDLERRRAELGDEIGETVREHPGLSGAGTCNHQDRSGRQGDSLVLSRIQPREIQAPSASRDGGLSVDHDQCMVPGVNYTCVSAISDFDPERHRAVVHQFDLHVRTEAAGGNRDGQRRELGDERLDERFGVLGASGSPVAPGRARQRPRACAYEAAFSASAVYAPVVARPFMRARWRKAA